ncbi:MAG TPA: glutamyl-tRNA reductase [Mycobacteriales bacterium]|nr:glutamyl-tRNA reductase [Mycobacteriales bacterium]
MTTLDCASLAGCRAPLDLLERVTYSRDELAARLPALRAASGADQIAVLSTCQRTELYAAWSGRPDPDRLLAVFAADRGLPIEVVRGAVTWWQGDGCARHLLRVTSGLESFVLGETEVIGQVRLAAQVARTAGVCAGELDALLRAAVRAARRVHRETSFVAAGRSVGAAAVDTAAAWSATHPVAPVAAHPAGPAVGPAGSVAADAEASPAGHGLGDRRVLMVGAGQIANAVVARATRLGATVTVCNRTLRHAERFAAAGAAVVDLTEMEDHLAQADVVVLGTAAPHRLVDPDMLDRVRPERRSPLLLVDLSVPRNVDPKVRGLPGVNLVDLADLRASGSDDAATLAADVAVAEEILGDELVRFSHWLRARSAVSAVRRLRAQADDVGRQEYDRVATRLPAEARALLELAVHRTVHRLVHAPTQAMLEAAATGDLDLVETLARALSPPPAVPTETAV